MFNYAITPLPNSGDDLFQDSTKLACSIFRCSPSTIGYTCTWSICRGSKQLSSYHQTPRTFHFNVYSFQWCHFIQNAYFIIWTLFLKARCARLASLIRHHQFDREAPALIESNEKEDDKNYIDSSIDNSSLSHSNSPFELIERRTSALTSIYIY